MSFRDGLTFSAGIWARKKAREGPSACDRARRDPRSLRYRSLRDYEVCAHADSLQNKDGFDATGLTNGQASRADAGPAGAAAQSEAWDIGRNRVKIATVVA